LLGPKAADKVRERHRAKHTGAVTVGFAVGCGLGAAGEAAIGLTSVALPTGLVPLAFAMRPSAYLDRGRGS
jgi:hypothetical protein